MKVSTCELDVSEDVCVRTCGYDGDMFTCLQTLKSCIFSGKAYVFCRGHRHGDERMRVLPASMHMIHLIQLTQILDHFFNFIFTLAWLGRKQCTTLFSKSVPTFTHISHRERAKARMTRRERKMMIN